MESHPLDAITDEKKRQPIDISLKDTSEMESGKPESTVLPIEKENDETSVKNSRLQGSSSKSTETGRGEIKVHVNEKKTNSVIHKEEMQDIARDNFPMSVILMSSPEKQEKGKKKTKTKFELMEFFATFVAAFSFLCTGVFRAYASPALASLEKDEVFLNTTDIPTKDLISWVASATPMAGFFGTIISGPLLQYYGRKNTIMFISYPFIIGCILVGFAKNVWMVLVGRAFTGVSTGLTTASAQLYVSECVRPQVRGSLGFMPSMMLALGVLVGFLIGATDIDWQELSLVLVVFPLLLFILSLVAPESPYWLVLQKREEDALKSLQKLRGKNGKGNADTELKEMILALTSSKHGHNLDNDNNHESDPSNAKSKSKKKPLLIAKLLNQRRIWLPTFISVCLMSLQQLCGINAVIYYLSVIIERSRIEISSNEAMMDPNVSSVIVGTVQFLAFFLSLPLIDRMGRRVLLIMSALLMALSHGSLALFFYCKDQSTLEGHHSFAENTFTWFPLLCLSVFISSFSIGFGPVPFIIMSEIFPSHIRSYLCSLSSLISHLVLFVVVLFFPYLLEGISPFLTFSLLALFCLFAVAFVAVFVPETKGKSLHEIELYFSNKTDSNKASADVNSTNL